MNRSREPVFLPYRSPTDSATPAFEAQRFAKGHIAERFGLHGHHFHQIIVCESGCGVHRVGDQIRRMVPGEIDIITEGIVHDTSAMDGACGWMLLIRTDEVGAMDLGDIFEPGRFPRLFSPPASFDRIRSALEAIADESSRRSPEFAAAMRAHLAIVLIELRRIAETARRETVAGETGHVARLLAEIDARLAGEMSLDALASSLGWTPGYLTSEVRRISGRTAMQWVTARRLRAAQKLLVETSAPIAEVAAAVGFVDGSHLARRFREEFRTSPGQWRKGMKRATPTANGT